MMVGFPSFSFGISCLLRVRLLGCLVGYCYCVCGPLIAIEAGDLLWFRGFVL